MSDLSKFQTFKFNIHKRVRGRVYIIEFNRHKRALGLSTVLTRLLKKAKYACQETTARKLKLNQVKEVKQKEMATFVLILRLIFGNEDSV